MSKMFNVNKVLSILLLVLALLIAFVSCLPQDNNLAYSNDSCTEDAYADEMHHISTKGTIIGDVVFDNTEVSRLGNEPFAEVLGHPVSEDGTSIFYDGFELAAFGWVDGTSI